MSEIDSEAVEAVARAINPHPFKRWQSMYDYCRRQGDSDVVARRYADDTHLADCERVLGQARDAIAALPKPAAADRIAMLESALRPFTDYRGSDQYLSSAPDEGLCVAVSFTAGDYRRARAALSDGGDHAR